jgi:hypothetical protein
MEDLPEPWRSYLRLQTELARGERVESRSWGLEAGLNRLLRDFAVDNVDRGVESEARKERNRAALRNMHLLAPEPSFDRTPDAALDAQRTIRVIRQRVAPDVWKLLRSVGEGYDFAELGRIFHVPAGTLRTRICRFREAFADLKPAV